MTTNWHDRGEAWVGALTLPDKPGFTSSIFIKSGRRKDSTIWGDTTLTGGAVSGIVPSFRDIDEERDVPLPTSDIKSATPIWESACVTRSTTTTR